jgi:hypothetical protein
MANAFLTSIGLLRRTDTGSFLPSTEVIDFLGAYEWDKKTASHKLAARLRETWFAQALLPRISFEPVDENLAVTIFSEAAGNAGPEYKRELRMLLEWLELGGVIQRDGGQVKQVGKGSPSVGPVEVPQARPEERVPEIPARSNRVNTSYGGQSPDGGVDFHVDVHVDMAEIGGWHPDRITAFFRGLALVLTAKSGIEKEVVKS